MQLSLGERGRLTSVRAMVFLSAATRGPLRGGEESSPREPPDVPAGRGWHRAGWASARPGGATALTDPNLLNGPGYVCGCQAAPSLAAPSACPLPGGPIRATRSSTRPVSTPRKLKGDMTWRRAASSQCSSACRTARLCQRRASSPGCGVAGDPRALTGQCRPHGSRRQPASPAGRGGRHMQVSREPHEPGPSPGEDQRLPVDTVQASCPEPPPACRPAFTGSRKRDSP